MLFGKISFAKNFGCYSFLLTISFLCVFSVVCKAQSKISGIIKDGNGTPLPDASVLLLNAKDSSLVKGSITSTKGMYSFENKKRGNYLISSSFTNYRQVYSPVFTISNINENVEIDPIILLENSKELDAVTVAVRKPLFEQRIDRMVINVKSSITSTGSTVLDILERSPGIIIDRQNNDISMSGKNGVVVMINGKINHMPISAVVQMLAGMSSSNVEKIELITTPPANFDAEGNAGFINIVLVNDPSYGTNGSYSATMGYGKGATAMASMNFNHRKGKINVNGDFSFSSVRAKQRFEFYRKVSNNPKVTETNSFTNRDPTTTNYTGRIGFDYQATKKTLIGMEVSSYDNKWKMNAQNESSIIINQHQDSLITINNDEVNHWFKYGGSLSVLHNIKEGEKINFELDYDHYRDNNPNNYLNKYFNGLGNFLYAQQTFSGKITPITILVASADYTKKLSKKTDMEVGIKLSGYRFSNDVSVRRLEQNVWVYDDELTARYQLKEDIPAAYSSFTINLSEKNSVKFGLRYEYTRSNLGTADQKNIVDRHYGELFPTFFASHKFNDNNSMNVSYARRITRPTFGDLAPFVIFLDPNTFISGNAAIQPSISNSVSIAYSFKQFLFSLSYSKEDNFISGFQSRIDSVSNKLYLIPQNFPNQEIISLALSLPFTITAWWNMQNNINGSYEQDNVIYNKVPLKIEQASFNVSSTQRFKLPKEFTIEMQGFYQSGGVFGTTIVKPLGAINFGIQKDLKDKKGKLSFNIRDVFNTLQFRGYNNFPEYNLIGRVLIKFNPRTFSLTYTHSFGNKELKADRNKSAASEEARKRVE